MAAEATYDGVSGAIQENIVRDLSSRFTVLVPENYGLFRLLMASAGRALSTKIEWNDDSLRAFTVTATSSTTLSDSDTTLVCSADVSTILRAGHILRNSQELMLVTAVSSTDVTVTRAYSGTTGAAVPASTTLYVVGHASLEGAAFSVTSGLNTVARSNYTQIFREDITQSGSLLATQFGTGSPAANAFEQDEYKAMKQIIRDMATSIIQGGVAASTPQGSASVRRTMDGIIEMARTGSGASQGAVYTDASSVDFNVAASARANLMTFLASVVDKGGTPDIIIGNTRVVRQLGAVADTIRDDPTNATIYRNVQRVVESTTGGMLRLILDQGCPPDTILALDTTKLALRFLRPPQTLEVERAGDALQHLVLAEATLEAQDMHTGGHGVGYGLAA